MASDDKQQSVWIDNLGHAFESSNHLDGNLEATNVVDGLFAIAESLSSVASALRCLGNGSASTDLGAVEALSMQIKEGLDGIASSIDSHADR